MFSALLSSRIAPSTERSASRLFGSGFSRVESTGMRGLLCVRLFFAFVPRSAREGKRGNFYSRHENFLFKRCRIVRGSTARVNRSACASLRKSLQNFFQPARGQRLELYHFSRQEHPSSVHKSRMKNGESRWPK